MWFYAAKLVWPTDLIFIYPRWQIDARVWWQYIFPIATAGVLAWLWQARRRIGKGVLVGVLCFCGMLLPALGIFDVYPMRYSFVADHFQYLASAGLLALAGFLASGAATRWHATRWWTQIALAAPLLLVLASLTRAHESAFKDLQSLWSDTLAKNPDCWMAHNNLGAIALDEGNLDEAEQHLRAALRLRPDHTRAHYTYGRLLVRRGRLDAAVSHLELALRSDRNQPKVYNELGRIAALKGEPARAKAQFSRAVELNPSYWPGHYNLGLLLLKQGSVREAVQHLAEAAHLNPDQAELQYNLGVGLWEDGRLQEAAEALSLAVWLQPTDSQFRFTRAAVLQRQGQSADAVNECQLATRSDPQWPVAAESVAWTLSTHRSAAVRDGTLALQLALAACDTTGKQNARALQTLAAAHAEVGRFDDATRLAQQALEIASAERNKLLERQVLVGLANYKEHKPFRQ